ncbi:MAG: hypothetical protein PHG16_08200 [Lachnospiraceae bacterium]|nr:hypothetical protein [Lachnospiraceae bacterium]
MQKKMIRPVKTGLCLAAGLLFLSGCRGTEPEKREYPLALAWDCSDEEYTLIYSFADLPDQTGQEKKAGEEIPGVSLTGSSLYELNQKYVRSQQYALDLGHVRAVIFSESLYQKEDQFRRICEALRQDTVMGKNAYVFVTRDIHELMKLDGARGNDSMGEYLTGLYENHPGQQEEAVTLEEVFYNLENERKKEVIPTLCVEGEQVILCGNESV